MTLIRDLVAGKTTVVAPPPNTPLTAAGIRPDDFPADTEQPISPMAQGYVETLRKVALARKRILICGCRTSNIGDDRAGNPSLLLWQSTNEGTWKRASVPGDIGAIIQLRWISHPASRAMQIQARARDIPITGILSTGDVRQLLDLTFKGLVATQDTDDVQKKEWERFLSTPNGQAYQNGAAADASAKMMAAAATQTPPAKQSPTSHARGNWGGGQPKGVPRSKTLSARVRRVIRPGLPATEEVERILPILNIPGLTAEKLLKTVYNVRHQDREKAERRAAVAAPAASAAPKASTHTPKAPEPMAAPAAAPGAPKAVMSIEDALRAIDAAMVAVQKGGEALVQARNAIIATRGSMHESILKAVQDKMLNVLASFGTDNG